MTKPELFGPAERLHHDEPTVAADDTTGSLLHDERLGLAELKQRGADRVEVAVAVRTGVGGISVQLSESDAADGESGFQVDAPRSRRIG